LIWNSKNEWKGTSVALPIGPTTKYIDIINWDGGCQFILSEDKKLLKIENQKEINDIVDLEGIIKDIPTSMAAFDQYISIGWFGGFVYTFHISNPEDLYQQPLPPYLGLGASEEAEIKEFPDTIILKMDKQRLVGVYSDRTMVIFGRELEMETKIEHIVQNHAKAIHSIQMLPNESSK